MKVIAKKHFRDLFSISMKWCYYIFPASTHQQPDERRLPLLVSFTVTKSPSHFESLQSFISLAVCLFIVFFPLSSRPLCLFFLVCMKKESSSLPLSLAFSFLYPRQLFLSPTVGEPLLLDPQFLLHLPPSFFMLCHITTAYMPISSRTSLFLSLFLFSCLGLSFP